MTSSFKPINSQTAFLNTFIDLQLNDEQLRIVLTDLITKSAYAVNLREIAQYDLIELLTGQQFFTTGTAQTKRFSYRKVFEFGAIATGATYTTAHGITGQTIFTKIYASCVTDIVDYRPIPYASAAAITDQISIRVVGANIEIVNGATSPNIASGIIVLEYLKN